MLRIFVFALLLAAHVPVSGQGFDDEFNSNLDPRWEWVRPDPLRQLLLGSGLTIITQNGALYGTQFNNVRNILLQDAPDGAYAIETKVDFEADSTFHNAGLIYYIDDDHFILISKGFYLGQEVAFFAWEKDGQFNLHTARVEKADRMYLRLTVRTDRIFTGEYSLDGSAWHQIYSRLISFPDEAARIGLQASNGEGVNVTRRQIPARFDYFRVNRSVAVHAPPAALAMDMTVSPMPVTRGRPLSVHFGSPQPGRADIRVISVLGKVVYNSQADAGAGVTRIPTEGFAPGMYLIHASGGRAFGTAVCTVLER